MLIEHDGKQPKIHTTARIAANAIVCGDVTVGAHTSVGFGAVLTAESGPVTIGDYCVIMEHAVLRGTSRAPLTVGNNVLIGPHAHLSGCRLEDEVFIATNASVFPHAWIGARSAIRIGAVVHIRTVLPAESSVPILWIAVGDPPEFYPAQDGERVLAHLRRLDFVSTVFGVERKDRRHMPEVAKRYTRALARHRNDRVVDPCDSCGSG